MKKVLKSALLVALLVAVFATLTGCGKKEDSNKLVGVKEFTDEGMFGKYTETAEVTFENDMAKKIVMSMEFEDSKKAETIKGLYSLGAKEGIELKVEGNKFIMEMDAEAFCKEQRIAYNKDNCSREALEKKLKDDGYTIK